jgi:hypothetical protein
MILHPTIYRRLKTSKWQHWPSGEIANDILKVSEFNSIYILGVGNIYSIGFGDIDDCSAFIPTWNSEIGWAVTFLDAIINKSVNDIKINYYKNNEVPQNNGDSYFLII